MSSYQLADLYFPIGEYTRVDGVGQLIMHYNTTITWHVGHL